MPIRHTHEDIKQRISRTTERRCRSEAKYLTERHTQLRQPYDGRVKVVHKDKLSAGPVCAASKLYRKELQSFPTVVSLFSIGVPRKQETKKDPRFV